MNKGKILETLIARLENDFAMMKEAARVAHDAATNEESKPENEYDTRALEASYLAGAQSKRAGEIEAALNLFKHVELKKFGPKDPIANTALVEIESLGKRSLVLLMALGGGVSVEVNGQNVQVITPNSVLGEALVGLRVDDVAEVETAGKIREYDILSVQ